MARKNSLKTRRLIRSKSATNSKLRGGGLLRKDFLNTTLRGL